MTIKQKDRHLETPSEANRDKHINFLAEEQGDIDPADEEVDNLTNEASNKKTNVEDGLDNGFFDEEEEDEKNTKNK